MQSVKYSEIPRYLQKGDFFRSLARDDLEGLVEIPRNTFHRDRNFADNFNEFRHLLDIAEFWMLDEIPPGILDFCCRTEVSLWAACCPRVFSIVARTGNIRCLRYLHEQGYLWEESTLTTAVQNGQVDCLLYLLMHGCPYDNRICDVACSFNQPTCLALLLLFDAPKDVKTSCIAAGLSDVACLQWLHESGCPWNATTTQTAAVGGHVKTLSYAMEKACPFGDMLMIIVVMSGSMECLQYLVECRNMAFAEGVYFVALLRGNVAHLQYLIARGCPAVVPNTYEVYYQIILNAEENPSFLRCVKMAVEQGWDVPDHFVRYIITRDISSYTKFCVDQGWLAHSSTGEGFLQFVSEVSAVRVYPCSVYLKAQEHSSIDQMFSKRWDDNFTKQNSDFVKAVYFMIALGWIPDTHIREITGIHLSHCFARRIMGYTMNAAFMVFYMLLQLPLILLVRVCELFTFVVNFEFGRLFWILSLAPMAFVRLCYLLIYPFYSKVKTN